MRKFMSKEVTFTNLKLAKMEINENGLPAAVTLPSEELLGSISFDKAQKYVNKKYNENITIYEITETTRKYTMAVEEFIKLATLFNDGHEVDENEEVEGAYE